MRNYLNDNKNVLMYTSSLIFSCSRAFLNGVYYTDPKSPGFCKGVLWYHWLGSYYSLKSTTMMIKKF